MRSLVLAVIAALAAGGAAAQEIMVEDATAVLPPGPARSAAGYLVLRNSGADDRLLGVEADGVEAMLHESREEGGVMRMSPVDVLEIPQGGSVAFEPGGLHVMFMGFETPPEAGDRLEARLIFEAAGEIPVSFTVEPFAGRHAGH